MIAQLHGFDAAVLDADDAVGQLGDGRVMRDDDDGRAVRAADGFEQGEHLHARFGIERAGRLVTQEQRGILAQGARDGYALLLAAGKLRREVT